MTMEGEHSRAPAETGVQNGKGHYSIRKLLTQRQMAPPSRKNLGYCLPC